jgi:hypothetical protein
MAEMRGSVPTEECLARWGPMAAGPTAAPEVTPEPATTEAPVLKSVAAVALLAEESFVAPLNAALAALALTLGHA